MFYVNSVTKERMTDHPLDGFYKQKFLRLKAEKEGWQYIPPEEQQNYQNDQQNYQNELSQNTGNIGQMQGYNQYPSTAVGMSNKTQDPLIRAEAEKKIRE